ncbi:TPA_asm: RNA-directed RNA polymerase [ssRNA phage Esthiorhiza.2_10]|uniref:RNA-directed RNA polymerase n=2 Tax=Leviviricetes TaxID=2842243 RepID=A0A8S5KXK4_9VIRU|nr:RNA-directed RNA polymerase [ssRNA phage Esthiorhiza.2_10]QDH87626.1 MAG: RNA-dependent RNA polymerase [Leviviridae sp.]DAD49960.1 TPA_asm: RNA-directed RNA polymerase [ssRNA phage Esthiorhiza.2_10]
MKSLILLWQLVAEDFCDRCCTSATLDHKMVQRRTEHEGLSFLTITLPSFGKEFQKALDFGIVDRNSFHGFPFARKAGKRLGIPAFLQEFLGLVFNPSTGVLLDEPNIDAILAIRQLTLMFSKVLLPCSDARLAESMKGYIECDNEVRRFDSQLSSADLAEFHRVSSLLFSSVLAKVDSDVYHGRIVPKHGPGATADRLRANAKFRQRTWTQRLERIFPFGEFIFPSWSYYDHFSDVDLIEPGAELPVRVISVPKTQKTPRIIAIEPTAMQYVQQGLLESILQHIEGDHILSQLLGFSDQTPNQRMAREGSQVLGNLATLDLSDASDRVSNQLVRCLLQDHPHLREAVEACRSRKADVPGHGVIRLAKFASMGSALTFPVEAMVFLTCTLMGICDTHNTPVSRQLISQLPGKVRIYGDDIIVPVDTVHSVVHRLESFGARVGANKSFWIGKFRESCGKEYYDGFDISIVKVRRMLPTSRRHVPEVISAVSLRNQLYFSGCWRATKWLDGYLRKLLKHFPTVLPSSPVLGRHSHLGYVSEGEHETLHRPFVKGYVVSSRLPRDFLEGPGALLKFFLKRGGQPSVDGRHLERAGRPHAVDIKLRSRMSPY